MTDISNQEQPERLKVQHGLEIDPTLSNVDDFCCVLDTSFNRNATDGRTDELGTDRENDCWMMNEFGSMNLLDESNYCIKEEEVSTAPIDRGWAWASVVGCFGMHVFAVGGFKSFGVLFVELENRYDTTSRSLASVQAVAVSVMMAMCPISNALSRKYGCHRVVFIGGILMSSGFVASSFVPSYEWLYLTYGVISGLGFGLSYAPCIVHVGQQFVKRRGLANGLSLSGSGMGTFMLPACIHFFNEWYGLSGALLIIGGLMLHVCFFASLFRPISSYKNKIVRTKVLKKEEIEADDQNEDIGSTLLNKSNVECIYNQINLEKNESKMFSRVQFLQSGSTSDILTASLQTLPRTEVKEKESSDCCSRKSKSKRLCDTSLFCNPVFLVLLTSATITNFAYPNVFLMIPSYAEEIGMEQQTGALLVSIIGISDLVGRVFMGWFSDRRLIPRKYEFMGTIGISGLLTLVLPFVKSKKFLFAYCGLYGFFAGCYICLIALLLLDALGVENLSVAFGFVGFGMTLGLLAGPPIIGALRDMTSSWDSSFKFIGMMALLGASVILLEPLAQKMILKKKRTLEHCINQQH